MDPPVRVEATQRWIPPQNTNSDTDTGGSNVGHYFVSPKGPQTGPDARKSSTSSHGQPPGPARPATQTDWAKHQQLFAVKLREWQYQVFAAEEELNTTLEAAKDHQEIEQAMEKYHKRMKDLLRDRGGELDELEQSVSGSASSAHSEDDEEGSEVVVVEEPEGLWEASGFDDMELAMNGQESPNPGAGIPGSNDSSDASDDGDQAPPPTENDEDHRAAQRRLNMQRIRGEKTLSQASAQLAKLTPPTGTSTPTGSRSMNIATLSQQNSTNSKASSFPSPSDSVTPIRSMFANPAVPLPRPNPAPALPTGNPPLSRAKNPRARSDTLTPNRPMSRPPDNSNWRQNWEESLRRAAQQQEGRRRHMQIKREQQETILRDIEAKRARGGSIGQSAGAPIGLHPRSTNGPSHQGTPPDQPVIPTSPPSPQGRIRNRQSQTHLQPLGQSTPRASIPSAGSSSRAIPTLTPTSRDAFNGFRTDKEDTDDDDSDEDETTESDRRPRLGMKNSAGGYPIANGKNQNQSHIERRSSHTPGAAVNTPTTPTTRGPYSPSLRPAASQASLASFNSMSSSTTASSARSSGAWSNSSTASSTGTFIPINEPPKSRRPSTTGHPINSGTTAGTSGTTSLGRKPSMGPLSTTPPNPPHWHPAGMSNASPPSAMSYAQTSGSLSRAGTMPVPHQSASIPIPPANSSMSQRAPQRHPSLGGIFPGSSPSAPISFSTSAGRDSSPLANMASSGANTIAEKAAWMSQPSPPVPTHTRPHGPVLQPLPLNRPPSSTPTPPISTPRGTPSTKFASVQSYFPGSTSPQNGLPYARQAAASKKTQRQLDKERKKQARAQAKEEAQRKEEERLAEEQRKADQRALERRQREEKKRSDEAKLNETRGKEDVSRKTLGSEEKRLKDQRKKLDKEEAGLKQDEERLRKARKTFEEHQQQFKDREDALDKKRLEHDLLTDERKKLEGHLREAEEKEAEYEREEEAERERLEREREQQQSPQDTSESSPENTDEEDEDCPAFSPQDSPALESPNKCDATYDPYAPPPTETIFPDEFFKAQQLQEQELQNRLSRRGKPEHLAADVGRRRPEESRVRQERREAQEREERETKAREERKREEREAKTREERKREEREAKAREERKREDERLKQEQRARDEQRAREAREARTREEQRLREEQRIREEQWAQDEQRAREERIRQENERLNQQFQAKERRNHAAKGHPRKVAEVWEAYEENWRWLNSQANSNFILTFAAMPWPVLNPPSEPDSITRKAISNFILSHYHSTSKTRKERLREALLKWHPDRFESRFLQKVPEGTERDRVREGVGNVIRCLNELTSAEAA